MYVEMNANEPLMKHRECNLLSKLRFSIWPRNIITCTCLLVMGQSVLRWH